MTNPQKHGIYSTMSEPTHDSVPAKNPPHRPHLPFAQRIPQDYQDSVLHLVAEGHPMATVVEMLENRYSRAAIYLWEQEDADFANRMDRARQIGRKAMADAQLSIADDAKDDDTAKVKKAELRIRTRQWLLERLEPETYSPRQRVDHQHTHRHELDADSQTMLAEIRDELRAERGRVLEGKAEEVSES